MPDAGPPEYRVFISSPSDVAEERARALAVVERLNGEFEGRARLVPIAWERRTYGAHADFQSQIEKTQDCHLVVGILWSTIGSPLHASTYAREDGSAFESGTAFEIETALEMRRRAPQPDVALFLKTAHPDIELNASSATSLGERLALLERIVQRWTSHQGGESKAAFNKFSTPARFEALFEDHLRDWLEQRGHRSDGVVWRIRRRGEEDREHSPYPGLEPYGSDRAEVFRGREVDLDVCGTKLREAARTGCAFLLIAGASGAGKSSLARAGLLPRLARPGTAPDTDGWRVAEMKPGAAPLARLAEELHTALPELASGIGGTTLKFAAFVAGHPAAAADLVAEALRRAGAAPQPKPGEARQPDRRLRLLLLVDQLEEAFTAPEAERVAFAAALAALARSGEAWVVATMRADRYEELLRQPVLKALKAEGANHDLDTPTAAEVETIIREPARLAGLGFEQGPDGRDLAEVLRRDYGGSDALPLLQMALAELFRKRDRATNSLTFAGYADLGGIAGAIETHAAEALKSTPPSVLAELPALLLGLVGEVSEDGRILAREMDACELADTPAREALLGAMVKAQLLLSEGQEQPDGTYRVRIRVAHEALLRNWSRATQVLDPDVVAAKPRVERALRDWEGQGRRYRDLLRGAPLDGAVRLVAMHGAALPAAMRGYVERSRRAVKMAMLSLATASVVFAFLAGGAGFLWFQAEMQRTEAIKAQRNADDQREQAVAAQRAESAARIEAQSHAESARIQREEANAQRNTALLHQARAVAALANAATDRGNAMAGLLAALEVLPRDGEKPWSPEAQAALLHATLHNREALVLFAHRGPVLHAVFSPDGQRMVTVSGDRTARLFDFSGGQLRSTVLTGHTETVRYAAFSPDGRRLITISNDQTARLWDVSGRRFTSIVLSGHTDRLHHAAFSPDGQHLVTTSSDRTARLWDLSRRQIASRILDGHTHAVLYAAFSPDGKRLATASLDRTARLWDLADPLLPSTVLVGHAGGLTHVTFDTGGQRLVTTSTDQTARLWDLVNEQPVTTVLSGHVGTVQMSAFSPDGRRLVTASADGTARVWTLSEGQQTSTVLAGHAAALHHAAFDPNGTRLVTTSQDWTARVWDLSTDHPTFETLDGHGGPVMHASFSPDGQRLATASFDGTVRLWNPSSNIPATVLAGHTNQLTHATFSPDGQQMVTSSWDGTARLWDFRNERVAMKVLRGHASFVIHAAFSADGRHLVTVSRDQTVRLWDLRDEDTPPRVLRGHAGSVLHVAFAPDGRRFATASVDRTVRLWDVSAISAAPLVLSGHTGPVLHATFSLDGQRLATASDDATARVWNLSLDPPAVMVLSGHRYGVQHAAFSPDGQRLATASNDFSARIWDLSRSEPTSTVLDGHKLTVAKVAFSPDGQRLVSASYDGTARLWDLTGERPTATVLAGHTSLVQHAAFSPDGDRLVTTSSDRTARLWDLSGSRPISVVLRGHAGVVSYAAFRPDGRQLVTVSHDRTARLWSTLKGDELLRVARSMITRCLSDTERSALGLPPASDHMEYADAPRPPALCKDP